MIIYETVEVPDGQPDRKMDRWTDAQDIILLLYCQWLVDFQNTANFNFYSQKKE